jgi:hypothetical protein
MAGHTSIMVSTLAKVGGERNPAMPVWTKA